MYDMMKMMFAAPSPAPAKKALELMGRIRSGLPRLPLAPVDEATLQRLRSAMGDLGLL
jgi:4-hydroxy-tetrahydrodipicolinate synthase